MTAVSVAALQMPSLLRLRWSEVDANHESISLTVAIPPSPLRLFVLGLKSFFTRSRIHTNVGRREGSVDRLPLSPCCRSATAVQCSAVRWRSERWPGGPSSSSERPREEADRG